MRDALQRKAALHLEMVVFRRRRCRHPRWCFRRGRLGLSRMVRREPHWSATGHLSLLPCSSASTPAAPAAAACFGTAKALPRRRRRQLGRGLVVRAERDFYQILGVARDSGGSRACGSWQRTCMRSVAARMPRASGCGAAADDSILHAPSRPADKKTIKSAYRQLARKFHPDVNKESDAEQRFKDISAAYEVRAPCRGSLGGAFLSSVCGLGGPGWRICFVSMWSAAEPVGRRSWAARCQHHPTSAACMCERLAPGRSARPAGAVG